MITAGCVNTQQFPNKCPIPTKGYEMSALCSLASQAPSPEYKINLVIACTYNSRIAHCLTAYCLEDLSMYLWLTTSRAWNTEQELLVRLCYNWKYSRSYILTVIGVAVSNDISNGASVGSSRTEEFKCIQCSSNHTHTHTNSTHFG